MLPEDGDAVEDVGDPVVVREAEGDGARVGDAREAEARVVAGGGNGAVDGDGGAEVEADGVVELVGVDAVYLRYVEVRVGGEHVAHTCQEVDEGETELRWEHELEDCLAKG